MNRFMIARLLFFFHFSDSEVLLAESLGPLGSSWKLGCFKFHIKTENTASSVEASLVVRATIFHYRKTNILAQEQFFHHLEGYGRGQLPRTKQTCWQRDCLSFDELAWHWGWTIRSELVRLWWENQNNSHCLTTPCNIKYFSTSILLIESQFEWIWQQ